MINNHNELNTNSAILLDPYLIKPKMVSFYETGLCKFMDFYLIFIVFALPYAYLEKSLAAFLSCILLTALFFWCNKVRIKQNKQIDFIEQYKFPPTVKECVSKHYPWLSEYQLSLVMQGLRQYFQLCRITPNFISMPSQVIDLAWHEFILYTKSYATFCQYGIGQFVHHTPTQEMPDASLLEKGMKEAWYLACEWEEIDQKSPSRLPFIFALDAALTIPDGFYHQLKNDYAKNIIAGGCGGNGCGGCGGC